MNRLLADLLEYLNIAIAIGIILIGAVIGYYLPGNSPETYWKGIAFGAFVGTVLAVVVCGIIANISLIEDHLRFIADDIEEIRARDAGELDDDGVA